MTPLCRLADNILEKERADSNSRAAMHIISFRYGFMLHNDNDAVGGLLMK